MNSLLFDSIFSVYLHFCAFTIQTEGSERHKTDTHTENIVERQVQSNNAYKKKWKLKHTENTCSDTSQNTVLWGSGKPIGKALTLSGRLFEVIMKTVQIKGFDKSECAPNMRPGNHTEAPPYKMAVVPPSCFANVMWHLRINRLSRNGGVRLGEGGPINEK